MIGTRAQQIAIELAAKEIAIQAGRRLFTILLEVSQGIDDEAQRLADELESLSSNRKSRRIANSSSSARLQAKKMEWYWGAFMEQLNLSVDNLTYASGQIDEAKKDEAIRLLALAVEQLDTALHLPEEDLAALNKFADVAKLANTLIASVLSSVRTLYAKYGHFDGMEAIADGAENILGRIPISFLHDVATSEIFYSELDPAFVRYFTKKYDACFKAELEKTINITYLVLDTCSQEPAGVQLTKPLIETASAKLPDLYTTNYATAEKLATRIRTYIDGIETNDPDGIHNMYRIPALIHSAPLVEAGNPHAATSLFDRLFPDEGCVDQTFRGELMPRLSHINTYAPELAATLFTRLSRQLLLTEELATLRQTGGTLFSRTAERRPDSAKNYWEAVLKLCDDGATVVAAVESTISAAQSRFIQDAAFAQFYLSRVSTTFSADLKLLSNVSGKDLVTGNVDGHFVVVGAENQTSILNGSQKPISGSAPIVLSAVMNQHPGELTRALSLINFVSGAQDLMSGRTGANGAAPYRQILVERVREIARAHS